MDSHVSIEGGISSRGRDVPPSHYLFKIESFSSLTKAPTLKCTSDQFEAGGYKWIFSLYPNGDKRRNGEGHISMYLELAEISSLPSGWEINAVFNFLIFNQLQDKYFILQDWIQRRYHSMKTEWGITKFIDLETFHNPLNGYLIDDTCVFGVEVFVVKNIFKGKCLSVMKQLATYHHYWKVNDFSKLLDHGHRSVTFGDYNWYIVVHPNGFAEAKSNNISIYLACAQSSIPPNTKLFVKFILRIKHQMNGEDFASQIDCVFSSPNATVWGFQRFMVLGKLKDPKQGYLVNDACIVEAEVTPIGFIKEY